MLKDSKAEEESTQTSVNMIDSSPYGLSQLSPPNSSLAPSMKDDGSQATDTATKDQSDRCESYDDYQSETDSEAEENIESPRASPSIRQCESRSPSIGASSTQETEDDRSSLSSEGDTIEDTRYYDPDDINPVEALYEQFLGDIEKRVPLGSHDYFSSIMPPLRHGLDVEKIVECLIGSGELIKHEDTYIWKEFQQDPKKQRERIYEYDEDPIVCNEPIKNVFDAIIRAAREMTDANPTLDLINDGPHMPWSVRPDTIRPDSNLVLRDSEESLDDRILLYNIAVPFELRTGPPNYIFLNAQHTIHNMQRIMAVDPCRRYVYGINIEDAYLRLWMASRTMIVAQCELEIRVQYKELIRMFLSLTYATKEELGWDTTIKAKLKGGDRLYDIKIDGEHYYTSDSELIFGGKVKRLLGPGTRIWSARRGSREDGEIVVVKDFWRNDEQETEDKIYETITDGISDPDKRAYFKGHTINIIASERVKACGTEDHTRDTILRGRSPDISIPCKNPFFFYEDFPRSRAISLHLMRNAVHQQYHGFLDVLDQNQQTVYQNQFHHRIVYKELAIPYGELGHMEDKYTVLIDVLKTLLIMHEAGYVHRDIGIGNIYLYFNPVTRERRGLIGDFEFAKKIGSGEQKDEKIGTPQFMATEVSTGIYLYRSKQKQPKTFKTLEEKIERAIRKMKEYESRSDEEVSRCSFRHNHLHDLESLWWVVVWTAFTHENASTLKDESTAIDISKQFEIYYRLFPGDSNTYYRASYLERQDTFETYNYATPHSFNRLRLAIIIFRLRLIRAYREAEENITGPIRLSTSGAKVIHEEIVEILLDKGFDDVELISIFNIPERSNKRQADEDTDSCSQDRKKARLD